MTTLSTTVTPQQFGAAGDGITDDLSALQAAINYLLSSPDYQGGTLDLGSNIYRITDRLVVGNFFVEESDCFIRNITVTKPVSYNETEYIKSVRNNQIKIIANGGGIYGDFTSTTLKAIIYYNCIGDTRAVGSHENYIGGIEGVSLYGKGSVINGKPSLLPNSTNWGYSNNQVGVICLYSFKMKVRDCTFYGLKEGIMFNNTYFSNIENCYFKLCERGIYHMQSHGSIIYNPTAYYCLKGYEIRSGQISMINVNTENCGVGLHIIDGKNTVQGCYLESGGFTTESQLIIGASPTDFNYEGYDADGISINAVTIVSTYSDATPATALKLKETAKTITINGGQIQVGNTVSLSVSNVLIMQGVLGGAYANSYERGKDITTNNLTVKGQLSLASDLSVIKLTAPSLVTADSSNSGNSYTAGERKQKSTIASASLKSKMINGISGSTDYIIKLGKYSSYDGSHVLGRLNILGSNQFTSMGYIDIVFSHLTTGFLKAQFSEITDTQYLTIGVVKYTIGADDFIGIRFTTNSSTAYIPIYFHFDGLINDNGDSLSAIAASSVTGIVAYNGSSNTKYKLTTNQLLINSNQINTPNFKSGTPGVKKGIYVDEFGNWSIQ